MCLCVFLFFRFFHWKHFRRFLKLVTWLDLLVLDLVLYLFVMVISTLMSLFGVFSTSGITLGCASGVSTFIFPTFIIGHFPFSWRNYRIFSLLGFPLFFYGCACWSSSGYYSTIGTLGGSALVNGHFDWDEFLIWFSSWLICLVFLGM